MTMYQRLFGQKYSPSTHTSTHTSTQSVQIFAHLTPVDPDGLTADGLTTFECKN